MTTPRNTVDAVVIGGGIAGVSIAYELAGHGTVLLLEAERSLAMHTTGRSVAIYAPSYGPPVVRTLTMASRPRFTRLAAELRLPAIFQPRRLLWVACDEDGTAFVRRLVDNRAAQEISVDEAVAGCPALNPRRLRQAAVDDSAMDMDVMALHHGYVRGLTARGGRIHTGQPVAAIRQSGDGWVVQVGAQRFATGLVVNAAGAWADRVAALAGVPTVGITPLRRTVAVASGAMTPDPLWPLVADGAERFYFRPEGTRVLISPADKTPSEPADAKPDELDIALAIERINEVTGLGLRSVHSAWAGQRSFVPDGLPVVGSWPQHKGFAFFAGQGGYGIQLSAALAAFGAAVLTGGQVPADIGVRPEELSPRMR